MYEILTLIIIFLVIAVVWGIIVAKKSEKRDKEIGAIDDCQIGKYIAGLPTADSPASDVDCAITKNHLVFFAETNKELGKIPRNSINQIIVDDKTNIAAFNSHTHAGARHFFTCRTKEENLRRILPRYRLAR